jgi:hypothetical protein
MLTMLRTFPLCGILSLTLLSLCTGVANAARPDLGEVCFHAAAEQPELVISERIVGYCTTAITESTAPKLTAVHLNNRAILRIRQNNRVAARADLDAALKADLGCVPAWISLAHLYWLEGNLPAAEDALSSAVRLGGPTQALVDRSVVRRTRGDTSGAMRDALLAAGYSEPDVDRLVPSETPGAPGEPDAPVIAEPIPATDATPPQEEEPPVDRD